MGLGAGPATVTLLQPAALPFPPLAQTQGMTPQDQTVWAPPNSHVFRFPFLHVAPSSIRLTITEYVRRCRLPHTGSRYCGNRQEG